MDPDQLFGLVVISVVVGAACVFKVVCLWHHRHRRGSQRNARCAKDGCQNSASSVMQRLASLRTSERPSGLLPLEEALELTSEAGLDLVSQSNAKLDEGDIEGAIADAETVLASSCSLAPGTLHAVKILASFIRGSAREKQGDYQGCIEDMSVVILNESEPFAGLVAHALRVRARAKVEVGDAMGAFTDFNTILGSKYNAYPEKQEFAQRDLMEWIGCVPLPQPEFDVTEPRNQDERVAVEMTGPAIDLRNDEERRIEQDAYRGVSLGPESDRLIEELIQIGGTDGYLSSSSGLPFDQDGKHARARAIGEALNERGGMKLMQAAHYRVRAAIPGKARSLEVAWGYIGEWRP